MLIQVTFLNSGEGFLNEFFLGHHVHLPRAGQCMMTWVCAHSQNY